MDNRFFCAANNRYDVRILRWCLNDMILYCTITPHFVYGTSKYKYTRKRLSVIIHNNLFSFKFLHFCCGNLSQILLDTSPLYNSFCCRISFMAVRRRKLLKTYYEYQTFSRLIRVFFFVLEN